MVEEVSAPGPAPSGGGTAPAKAGPPTPATTKAKMAEDRVKSLEISLEKQLELNRKQNNRRIYR